MCNLKNSVPKKIPTVFHNGSNFDYHFIIKKLAEEFEKQFSCLEESTEKYINFTVPIEKEVTRIDKNGGRIKEVYLTYYTLLIVLDLWQAHYQILSIIFLKEFVKFNVNVGTTIKNVKLAELNVSIATVLLNT